MKARTDEKRSDISFTRGILTIVLVAIYTFAGGIKLWEINAYQSGLENAPFIPSVASTFLAYTIPLFCFAICIMLIYGFFIPELSRPALLLYLGSISVFTLYIAYILVFTERETCTCLGLMKYWNWTYNLLLNIGVLILLVITIRLESKEQRVLKISVAIDEAKPEASEKEGV
ncbi:hypothetical protein SAMN05216436_12026 [bacterium A37T11]|nr:hypothetical protein SAMN05216436_12026 [bacterium A37T11]